MDRLPVIYFIGNPCEAGLAQSISQVHDITPNSFELSFNVANREIYLLDILKYFQSLNLPIGYEFAAFTNLSLSNFVPLASPSCVVPVLESERAMIFLFCYPAVLPSLASLTNVEELSNLSRYAIYSNKHAKAADLIAKEARSKWYNPAAAALPVNSAPSAKATRSANISNNTNVPTPAPVTVVKPPKPTVPTAPAEKKTTAKPVRSEERPVVPSKTSTVPPKTTSYEDSHSFNNPLVSSMASSSSGPAPVSHGNLTHAGSFRNFVEDDAVTKSIEVAKSIFSFATASLKNVTEVATNLAGNLNTSVTTVGGMKVTIVKELADGGFGKVYLVSDVKNPTQQYALKQMHCQSSEQDKDVSNEIQALQSLRHENIIRLIDSGCVSVSKSHRTYLLLFPLCSNGTAWDYIANANPMEETGPSWPFTEKQALSIIFAVTKALAYMHQKGYTHRDIKPHNILIGDDNTPLLTDFGSIGSAVIDIHTRSKALQVEEEAASKTSAAYRPPELTQVSYPATLDARIDVWSLGCTLYCLAFGWSPFESKKEGIKRLAILNGKYSYPSPCRMRNCSFSKPFCDLIDSMLQLDLNSRPHCKDLLPVIQRML